MPSVLHIVELYPYPAFSRVFQNLNLELRQVRSMRIGLRELERAPPDILLAEFNYLPTYGTQISNLQPVLAKLELLSPRIATVVIYEPDRYPALSGLQQFSLIDAVLPHPVAASALEAALRRLIADGKASSQ